MKIKKIMRWDDTQRKYRLFRATWTWGDVGYGGYSVKVSLAIRPKWLGWGKEYWGCTLTMLGFSMHYKRSYGGTHA